MTLSEEEQRKIVDKSEKMTTSELINALDKVEGIYEDFIREELDKREVWRDIKDLLTEHTELQAEVESLKRTMSNHIHEDGKVYEEV